MKRNYGRRKKKRKPRDKRREEMKKRIRSKIQELRQQVEPRINTLKKLCDAITDELLARNYVFKRKVTEKID